MGVAQMAGDAERRIVAIAGEAADQQCMVDDLHRHLRGARLEIVHGDGKRQCRELVLRADRRLVLAEGRHDIRLHELQQARGLFVTLTKRGQLRGCIGRITSDEPLATLLPTVALESALRDTRFAPVNADELNDLTVEVSILTPPQMIRSAQEIVAGRDGVVLQYEGHSGVFLPQVWQETGWTRVEFLRELASQKAGLDPDAWQHAQLSTFRAQVFSE